MSTGSSVPAAVDDRFPLEAPGPLSQSVVWRIQRSAYERQGVEGWAGGLVPSYATTNPHFVAAEAALLVGFLRDCVVRPDFDPTQPVHIVELGSGPGRFGYQLVTELREQLARTRLRDVPIRYVLTDLVQGNVDYWRAHPRFAPLIEAGIVDVARFDVEAGEVLELQASGTTIGPGSLANPGAVITNYLLDTVPQDIFRVSGGALVALHVTARSTQPEPDLDAFGLMRRVDFAYEEVPLDADALDAASLAALRAVAAGADEGANLLFPSSALRCLGRLARFWDGRMLLVAADKAFAAAEEVRNQGDPHLEFHGSAFSMTVDFLAIAEWFAHHGGRSRYVGRPLRLHLSASVLGFGDEDIELDGAFRAAVEEDDPADFYGTVLEGIKHDLDVDRFFALIRVTGGDPTVFLTHLPLLGEHIRTLADDDRDELRRLLELIWSRYYPIGEGTDLAYYLSYAYHELGDLPAAMGMLHNSLEIYGETGWTLYNLAQCLHEVGDLDAADAVAARSEEHEESAEAAAELRAAIAEARLSS